MKLILPEAKRLDDEYVIKNENQNLNPFAAVYRFLTEGPLILITVAITFLSAFIAAILSDIEEVSMAALFICVIMMGLTFILAAVNKKTKVSGTGSSASIRRAFLIVGFLIVFFPSVYFIGSGMDSVKKTLPFVFVIIDAYWILNGIVLPFVRYSLIKKRMERCTEGAVAHLTNTENGSMCADKPENEEMSAYEYVYEFLGSRYQITTFEKNNIITSRGCDLPVDVDPEAPENYYSPDLIYTLSFKDTLIKCLTNVAFALVFIFVTVFYFTQLS